MNAETKHTPGPWTYFYKHKYDEWHVALPMDGSQMKTALCDDGIQSANREADARLIAAAPEMAEALTPFKALADAYFRDGRRDDVPDETAVWGFNDWTLTAGDLRRACAVLSKAGG